MRVLTNVRPTGEQLKVINDRREGVMVVRGAAGSGKTTTAVLRLRHMVNIWRRAAEREGRPPIRVLVLSFNRTLRGYVEQLVREQIGTNDVDLTLDTFGGWALPLAGHPTIVSAGPRAARIAELGRGLALPQEFLVGEVDYVLGRYPASSLDHYTDTSNTVRSRREGRGSAPAMQADRRRRLVDEVLIPYDAWKAERGEADWNDVAVRAAAGAGAPYDVVVVDEAQDFSANMVRAVLAHLADEHSVTFVLDTTQRVYPHGFRWNAVDLDVRSPRDVVTLAENHRNTKQIAALARPLVEDLPGDEDGQLPDFDACEADGVLPLLVRGRFVRQLDWLMEMLRDLPDDESVALLHPKGGGWLDFTRARLTEEGLHWVDLQQRKDWPTGPEQIGLSTLHSSKGLEFDHVVLLGLEQRHMPHGEEAGDTQLHLHRRLLAMAIGRARRTVTITCKSGTEPDVLALLDPATYRTVDV